MPGKILVVDDDPHIREILDFTLSKAGHATVMARNGVEALALLDAELPDLVVLDVGMPELDGLEVCRRLRQRSAIPILFLSARDEEIDRVLGLEIGGDDYVVKPFSPRELVARIGVLLRRRPGTDQAPLPARCDELSHGQLNLFRDGRAAILAGRELQLTAREAAILLALAERPGHVIARANLLARAYGENSHVSDRTIDSHVRNIRAKCGAIGVANAIETLHGIGFRLGPCTIAAAAIPARPDTAGRAES